MIFLDKTKKNYIKICKFLTFFVQEKKMQLFCEHVCVSTIYCCFSAECKSFSLKIYNI